ICWDQLARSEARRPSIKRKPLLPDRVEYGMEANVQACTTRGGFAAGATTVIGHWKHQDVIGASRKEPCLLVKGRKLVDCPDIEVCRNVF
ncbi:MAG: hypothetical protein Q9180_003841, partial [Flavoplaca navasiana]